MRTLYQFKLSLKFLFVALIFFSCSPEESILETEQSAKKFKSFYEIEKGDNSLNKSTIATCAKENVLLESAVAGIYLNGGKSKTMNTYLIQGIDGITISAYYYIDADLSLPARINISLGNEEFLFKDVGRGQTVSHKFSYPEGWQAGDELSYQIDQTVYLAPISVVGNLQLLPLCEINIGENLLGGIVGYIYQPGDEGYIEGETHGIILNHTASFSGNWFDSNEWVNNLDTNNYYEWSLPTIDELEILMSDFPSYFYYNDFLYYGYWSSTNYDLIEGWAHIGSLSGFITTTFSSRQIDKSNALVLARAVRYF